MKINQSLITVLCLATLFTACKTGPHTVMATSVNGNKTSIEYYGKIAFTEDNKAVKSMAKHSQIAFKKNGKQIIIERNTDAIIYKVNDTKIDSLNSDQKQMIAEIIQLVHKT